MLKKTRLLHSADQIRWDTLAADTPRGHRQERTQPTLIQTCHILTCLQGNGTSKLQERNAQQVLPQRKSGQRQEDTFRHHIPHQSRHSKHKPSRLV